MSAPLSSEHVQPERAAGLLIRHPLRVAIPIAVLLIGIASAPMLRTGFIVDELFQLSTMERGGGAFGPRPWNLWALFPGEPEAHRQAIHEGMERWHRLNVSQDKMMFLRPVSSLVYWAAHGVFGRNATGYHVLVLGLFAATVALVGLLLKRLLPAPAAAFATLLFALSASHSETLAVICTLHIPVGTALGLLAFAAHEAGRRADARGPRLLALALFAAALLAGEVALQVMALLVGWEAVAGKGSRGERLRAVLPLGGLAVAYLVMHRLLGYGASGNGYVDPLTQASLALSRVWSELLPGFFSILFAHTHPWYVPGPHVAQVLGAIGVTLLLVGGAIARAAPEQRRALAGLALGTALASIPLLFAQEGARALFVPCIGTSAIVGFALWEGVRFVLAQPRRPVALAVAALVLAAAGLHLVWAPVELHRRLSMSWPTGEQNAFVETMARVAREAEVDRQGPGYKVLVTSPTEIDSWALRLALPPTPGEKDWWDVSVAGADVELHRSRADSLELKFLGFVENPGGGFKVGDEIPTALFRVRVLEATAQQLRRVAFQFDRPLDSATLAFVRWEQGKLRQFTLPGEGETLLLRVNP